MSTQVEYVRVFTAIQYDPVLPGDRETMEGANKNGEKLASTGDSKSVIKKQALT
jgi:hypothetical protein